MTRTMTLCAALVVGVLTVMPAEAGRWIPSSCGECAGKPMWVILLNETAGDTRTVAHELTAKYGGHTRAVWPGVERKFAVEATQEEARAMLADGWGSQPKY